MPRFLKCARFLLRWSTFLNLPTSACGSVGIFSNIAVAPIALKVCSKLSPEFVRVRGSQSTPLRRFVNIQQAKTSTRASYAMRFSPLRMEGSRDYFLDL